MSKWRVWRHPLSGKWIVNDPDRRLVQAPGDTWREALAHADRMARTVEVVLPRTHVLPTGRHTVQKDGLVIEYVRSRSQPQIKPGHLVVEPWERRPLALALLALAEKEEVERP